MESKPIYDSAFYNEQSQGSQCSARQVLPLVQDWIHPRSVIDVGCGVGAWLSVWQELGIHNFLGVDGDYVDRDQLLIPQQTFLARNLVEPLDLDQRFDLAMSLEVAEHLPLEAADAFVETLVQLSDVVLFSAAIPFQGGTGHLNEQWTKEWIKRFEQQGYRLLDLLRHRLWENPNVEPWYIQNLLLFIRSEQVQTYPNLPKTEQESGLLALNVVHPRILQNSLGYYTNPLKTELAQVQAELNCTQQTLAEARREIAAMHSSKFWRLRTQWIRLKQAMQKAL